MKRAAPLPDVKPDPDTSLCTLGNGVRVVTVALPHTQTASVSVFVQSGSQHESARLNGISHFVEHMAFKGTHSRDCQRINLDAERLGAEVNAHTDKDHTAYHMRGLAHHARDFVRMLGDIVIHSSFPAHELERERQVILHELIDDEEDPMSVAYRLFDQACFGKHALARPVIGTRRNIGRISRDDLLACVQRQYSGANLVVGVAGNVDPAQIVAEAEAAFGAMPAGSANRVDAPHYLGGISAQRLAGSSQTQVVLGFPIPGLHDPAHQASVVAAAVFGEGMSSPLLDQIRERRGLVYHAACSADVGALAGQFVIEASTAPEQLDEFFAEVMRLLAEHAAWIDPVALERAHNQIAVRQLRAHEKASQRLEAAALDLFHFGRIRSRAELSAQTAAVDAPQVQRAFGRLLAARPSVALAGRTGTALTRRIEAIVMAQAV